MNAVRVLERRDRRVPFGLRLWDVAAGIFLAEELEVNLLVRSRPQQRVRCPMNRSGVFYAVDVPGLRAFESSDPETTALASLPFRVEIRDPDDLFLPIAFDVDLPNPGPITSLPPLTAPPRPLGMTALASPPSPPLPLISGVPMFSSTSRPVPEGLGVVRADVREVVTNRPAAWCLLVVSIDGKVRGIGLADRNGRMAVLFPYPERPRPALASPPLATNDFRWAIDLSAFYVPPAPSMPVPELPDLAAIAGQLSAPKTLFSATGSPPQKLPPLPLEYRVPLTVRTASTPGGPSPFLFVSTD